LTCVDEQVDQDALDLVTASNRFAHLRIDLRFHKHAIFSHFSPEQFQRIIHDLGDVGWLHGVRTILGLSKNGAGDFRGPLRRVEDASERLVSAGFIAITQAELGVIHDRHQQVVELVRGGSGQLTQRRQRLESLEFLGHRVKLLRLFGFGPLDHEIGRIK